MNDFFAATSASIGPTVNDMSDDVWVAAMRGWWQAALDQYRLTDDPQRAARSKAGLLRVIRQQVRRYGGNPGKYADGNIRNWTKRGSVPDDPGWPQAILSVMRQVDAPDGLPDVGITAGNVVRRTRARTPRAATAERKQRGHRVRTDRVADLLLWPVQVAAEVNLGALDGPRLGSWLLGGAMPDYVGRDLDTELDDRLTAAADGGGLVVMIGEPKSGKTRTLLEALARVVPQRVVWSINPATNRPLDPVLAAVTGDGGASPDQDPNDLVVVFDDLQNFLGRQTHPISHAQLLRLTDRGVVVAATMHADAWQRARAQLSDHRPTRFIPSGAGGELPPFLDNQVDLGLSPQLVALIDNNHIQVPTKFSLAERDRVGADISLQAAAHVIDVNAFVRLPELLAAVDQMRSLVDAAVIDSTHPQRRALLHAAVDAAFAYPAGASEHELEQLFGWAFEYHDPTRIPRPTDFHLALDWATTPVGGTGSPHAIILPTSDRLRLRLFDSLLAHLTRDRRPVPPYILDRLSALNDEAVAALMRHSREIDDLDAATALAWRLALSDNPDLALAGELVLGSIDQERGRLDEAREHYLRGITSELHWLAPRAHLWLGLLEQEADNVGAARTHYQAAIESGDLDISPRAALNLGRLETYVRDTTAARDAYRLAIDSGHAQAAPEAGFQLGSLEAGEKHIDAARAALSHAVKSTRPAMRNYVKAWIADLGGDYEKARTIYQKVIEAGSLFELLARSQLSDLETRVGNWTGAIAPLRKLLTSNDRDATSVIRFRLLDILQSQIAAGEFDQADQTVALALESVDKELGPLLARILEQADRDAKREPPKA